MAAHNAYQGLLESLDSALDEEDRLAQLQHAMKVAAGSTRAVALLEEKGRKLRFQTTFGRKGSET